MVTVDVSSFYTNKHQGEGLEAVKDALECSYKFLISLLNTNHIDNQHIYLLEFNGEHFIWLIGTAMRAVHAVRYAKNWNHMMYWLDTSSYQNCVLLFVI